MSLRFIVMSILLTMVTTVVGNATPSSTPPTGNNSDARKAQVLRTYGKLPLSFEVNAGQTDKQVKFLSRGSGHSLFLTPKETVLVLSRRTNEAKHLGHEKPKPSENVKTSVLRIQLKGANPTPEVKGENELPGKSNYLTGKNPKRWHTNVANYAKVRYHEIYPGIDLVYYGNQRQLEYDFVLAPGADPKAIAFHIEGADGIKIDDNGDLVLTTKNGEVRQHKPVVYQEVAGKRREINGRYTLKGKNEIGFTLAGYDRSRRLVIDPVVALDYSTYLGGSADQYGNDIAVDTNGNAYVVGITYSTDFPIANAYQPAKAGNADAFITKFNTSGNTLIYSTYLGGSNYDYGNRIAVDTNGNAYVVGYTVSTNFPTANAYQPARAGSYDAFVTKLNASGSALIYSTYLGGSSSDFGYGVAADSNGNAYVTGYTASTDFPTANAYQPAKAGSVNAFVTKFNASGNALVYSTYLGGSGFNYGYGIATDSNGNAYVAGGTSSTVFPTANAYQSTLAGGYDAFVTKFNASGSALVYSTYLGGSGGEEAYGGIATDSNGNAYVTGYTYSTDFPTANAYQPANAGYDDAFVTKFDASGTALAYSTYLGGNDDDEAYGIAVGSNGIAYVTGYTYSTDFPTANAYQPAFAGGDDAFVTGFNASGNALYSTYLGGSGYDEGYGIAADTNGNAYVTGYTVSTDFPTANAYQPALVGDYDAFVAKLAPISCSSPPRPGDIVGTPGNDTLYGTPGNDRIFGLGGNDVIDGLGGNDIICGGPGGDTLTGGAGDDDIDGGDGNDIIHAGDGLNTVHGGNGNDEIVTGAGNDMIDAGAGADEIDAGDGNDSVDGGDGNDSIIAGPGNDTVYAGAGNDDVNAGPGADKIFGQAGNDRLNAVDGVSGNDYVDGGPQRDTCTGDPNDIVVNCSP